MGGFFALFILVSIPSILCHPFRKLQKRFDAYDEGSFFSGIHSENAMSFFAPSVPVPSLGHFLGTVSQAHSNSRRHHSLDIQRSRVHPESQKIQLERETLRRKISRASLLPADINSHQITSDNEEVSSLSKQPKETIDMAEEKGQEVSAPAQTSTHMNKPDASSQGFFAKRWKNLKWQWRQAMWLKAVKNGDTVAYSDYLSRFPSLLDSTNEDGQSLLMLVAYYGNEDALKVTMSHKLAKVLDLPLQHVAYIMDGTVSSEEGHLALKNYINLPDHDKNTALFYAALSEKSANVALLVAWGANIYHLNKNRLSAKEIATSNVIRGLLVKQIPLEECAVCLESFKETSSQPVSLSFDCGHPFHKDCTRNLDKCPLCRRYRRLEGDLPAKLK